MAESSFEGKAMRKELKPVFTAQQIKMMLENFDKTLFVSVLKNAKKGWFDDKRWNFWHLYLGLCEPGEVPPLPKRKIVLPNGEVLEI